MVFESGGLWNLWKSCIRCLDTGVVDFRAERTYATVVVAQSCSPVPVPSWTPSPLPSPSPSPSSSSSSSS
eukprot:1656750-Lingulodinium_polyedra.AAC.1